LNGLIRPFEERDYERLAEISSAIDSERARDAEWFRRDDAAMDVKMHKLRLVGEADGKVVAWGDIFNTWWMYHPRKFNLRLFVDPHFQGRGLGSAIYTQLIEHTERGWNPLRINAQVRETRPAAVAFAEHRGFLEVARRWGALLRVQDAPLDRLPPATARLQAQGLGIATMAEERARRGDNSFTRELFDVEQLIYLDEPGYDPEGALQFEQFVANELDPDSFLADASFVALDGTRIVGLSRLERESAAPHRLHVGFTGTHPDYRGHGIALALKLCTIDYARAHGFTEMSTTNDSNNAPMLHINAELGFQRLPAWIVFEKRYAY
jgi:GNAT superfamily N-acetyltransferase